MKVSLISVTAASALLSLGLCVSLLSVNAVAQGSITGTVKLNGTAPHMRGIDMSKDPYCVKQHESNPAKMDSVVVGAGGGVANVVLYISEGLPPNLANAAPAQELVFDQKGCMYSPHVLVMDVNQKFKVTSSDDTTHNIHPLPDPSTGNIPWNKSQPPGAPPIENSWKAEEVAIPVKCNIHPWMHGWFVVVKGPYAMSNDQGAYTIKGLPAGNYTVTAWHETFGTQTQKVTVAAGKPAAANFTFQAK